MSTLVSLMGNRAADTSGSSSGGLRQRGTKALLPTSTGGLIMVIVDSNRDNAASGFGNQSNTPRIEVWYSANRSTFTRVANFIPTDPIKSPYIFSADLFSDNSVGICWAGNAGLKYRKLTFSTWTLGAETNVFNNPANGTIEAVDISVSDTGSVLIASAIAFSAGTTRQQYRVYCQRAAVTTFSSVGTYTQSTVTERNSATTIAIAWGKGTLVSGKRTWMVIYGAVNASADMGFSGWVDSMDESVTPVSTVRVQVFANVSTGSLATDSNFTQWARTAGVAATNEDHTFLFGGVSVQSRVSIFFGKIHFNGNAVTHILPTEERDTLPGRAILGVSGVAITLGTDAINFLANVREPNIRGLEQSKLTQPKNWVATIKKDGTGFYVIGPNYFSNNGQSARETMLLLGGGGRNARNSKRHDMLYLKAANATGPENGTHLYHQYAVAPLIPPQNSPKAGSTVSSSTPPVSLHADLDRAWPQTGVKAVFQFAKDATFTTNLRSFTQDDEKYTQVVGTNKTGATVRLIDVLPDLYELSQGEWYMRSALRDAFNQQGAFLTNAIPFTVSHPPSVAEMHPAGDLMIAYTAGQVQFSWKFTDSSQTDYQTAFQVIVYNNTTDEILYDSGKLASSSTSHVAIMPLTAKETVLRWTVKLWDKDNVGGPTSVGQTFFLADAPVVAILSPTANEVLTTGVPKVTFNSVTSGDRKIVRYKAVWTKNGVPVYSSGDIVLSTPVSSGVDITHQAPDPKFTNLTGYSVQVFVTDEFGLEGSSPLVPVQTSFVVPSGPVSVNVSAAAYNLEGGGYVELTWGDQGRDTDFQAWIIYRKDDIIDPYSGSVIAEGTFEIIGYVYEVTSSYVYRDYYAPSSYRSTYLVKQMVNRYGDIVESANTTGSAVFPQSEGYWLVQQDDETGETKYVVRLYNVISDDYVKEVEEVEYTVVGRGRHVDRGDYLGDKGSLVAQIRDSAGKSARQRKHELENLQESNTSLYVRNPFGDVIKVSVGSLQISRVAGVGTSEFVDITIPYSEVY